MYNRNPRPLTSSTLIADILADRKPADDHQHTDIAELIERVRVKTENIDHHVSSLPARIQQTRAILTWQRYSQEKDTLNPLEHNGRISGTLYHLNHYNFEEEDKPLIQKLIDLLEDLKSQYNEDFVRQLLETKKTKATSFSAPSVKSDKELIREQIQRLTIERDQATKEKRTADAARTNKLITMCEYRLFQKPIKDREIAEQKRITSTYYFGAIMGKDFSQQ